MWAVISPEFILHRLHLLPHGVYELLLLIPDHFWLKQFFLNFLNLLIFKALRRSLTWLLWIVPFQLHNQLFYHILQFIGLLPFLNKFFLLSRILLLQFFYLLLLLFHQQLLGVFFLLNLVELRLRWFTARLALVWAHRPIWAGSNWRFRSCMELVHWAELAQRHFVLLLLCFLFFGILRPRTGPGFRGFAAGSSGQRLDGPRVPPLWPQARLLMRRFHCFEMVDRLGSLERGARFGGGRLFGWSFWYRWLSLGEELKARVGCGTSTNTRGFVKEVHF
jgi:hypothetical protein